MRFKALGPLRVLRGDDEVDIGPLMHRRLLALLLIHHNEVVPTDAILEALWDSDEAGERKSTLQVYISRLRARLEPDRKRNEPSILKTQEHGYSLTLDPTAYDVVEFEQQLQRAQSMDSADPSAVAEAFSAALEFWNGDAFEEFAFEDFAHVERARLGELWAEATEARIGADLASGRSGELVSELEVLRSRHPFREGLVSHQMLALYRSGRPADALRAMSRFRRQLGDELGIEPTPSLLRLEEQILLNDERLQGAVNRPNPSVDKSWRATNPYKGLEPFGADDATSFFGRDTLTAELLRMISGGESLVALVGASGSGKSSVIRAGLVPALTKGAIPGSDRWLVATMTPGAYPFAEVEAALLRSTIDSPDSLAEQLEDRDAGILRAMLRVLPREDDRLVLIIDQFEELFTLVESDEVRTRFLSNLVTAMSDPHNRICVVLTIRADFYERPLRHPEFGARLGSGIVNVTPLTAEELDAAATHPAAELGVTFEPSLVGQLIADVGNQPGALPMFQYALTELFDRRAGDVVTMASYRAMGGLEGAIQRRADDLFERLDADEQRAARQLFLRLVIVSDHDQRSRRRVSAREIASLSADTVTMRSTIAKLGEHRLLSFDSDRLTGAPTVEVAHEALLTAWPMLESWIDESRDDMRRHTSLAVALREWQLADEQSTYLLSAARLAEFRDWERTANLALNEAERRYLAASATAIEKVEQVRETERRRAARGRRRLLGLIAALTASLAVAALFLAGVFDPAPGPTVTYFGQRNSDRVSDSIKSGLDRAAVDLDIVLDDVRWTVDLDAEFAEFAAGQPTFVIGDSSIPFEPQIYFEHPDIRFGIIDPAEDAYTSLPNVSYVNFLNEEGGFLAGVVAASTTETGIVGFVGGMRIRIIEEFRAGFEAGVAAVDSDVEVLSTFVSLNNDNGFADPDGGDARATALYERGADVVFHAAGLSGQGIFVAADRYSADHDTHVWGIGVDVDQWFDLSTDLREHVLTSIIKRQDVAAYRLVEDFITEGTIGLVEELGVAETGYDYATSGDAMSAETIAALERSITGITAGDVTVPTNPSGAFIRFDERGQQIETLANDELFGPDFAEFSPIAEGTYEVTALGTPMTVEIVGDWRVQINMLGHTVFSHPESQRVGDRDLVFLRPVDFADPVDPGGAPGTQRIWPALEMNGLAGVEEWLAALTPGIISEEPRRTTLAGRDAVYFEVELDDSYTCGTYGYCAGFLVNTITTERGISGWAFEPGFHQRVWVIDGGDHPPVVVVASTPRDDRSFQTEVDVFLDRITIGDPVPHPIPVATG